MVRHADTFPINNFLRQILKMSCSPCVPDIPRLVHIPGQCSCTLLSAPLLMRVWHPSTLTNKNTLYIGHNCCVLFLIMVAEH